MAIDSYIKNIAWANHSVIFQIIQYLINNKANVEFTDIHTVASRMIDNDGEEVQPFVQLFKILCEQLSLDGGDKLKDALNAVRIYIYN